LNISSTGIELIKHFESLRLKAYKDPVGVWTIGWGHTKNVTEGMVATEKEATAMFFYELEEYQGYIQGLDIELNQDQFDALVSWVYNLGPSNLISSTMLKRLRSGDFWDVPTQIRRWDKAGGRTLRGLTRRRNAEALLFESKDWTKYDEIRN